MSFLAEIEDEQLATLEFAFALIDSADNDGTSSDSNNSNSSSDTASASASAYELVQPPLLDDGLDAFLASDAISGGTASSATLQSSDADLVFLQPLESITKQTNPFAVAPTATTTTGKPVSSATPRAKKARSNAGAVARHRERKKAEMVTLRSQVGELEATLAQLQSRRVNRGGALQYLLEQQRSESHSSSEATHGSKNVVIKPKQVSVWLDVAAFQAQERYKSESLNTKLKDAIARQMKVVKALEDVLGKKANVYGLDLLLGTQQQELRDDFLLAQEDHVFDALRDELKQMYFAADALFDPQCWAEAVESVSCSTQVKTDPVSGDTFMEVRTSTPLRCAFQKSGNEMWDRMCKLQTGHDKNYHVKKRVLTDTSFQKCYTLIIDGPDGRPLELRGVSYVEMVEEASRMVWMWRSLLLTTDSGGPRFAEKGWIVSEGSKNIPSGGVDGHTLQPTSVYRSCYQVSCDTRGNLPAQDASTSVLIETVLRTLSARTRAHQQMQQNLLLDEFAGLPIQRPIVQLLA